MNDEGKVVGARNLFRSYMTFGCISLGLGLNFLLTTPTFNPYHVSKFLIGTVFAVLGLAQIGLLLVRQVTAMRAVIAVNIAFFLWWGYGSVISWRQGLTSVQLAVLYVGLAALETWMLIENPIMVTGQRRRSR